MSLSLTQDVPCIVLVTICFILRLYFEFDLYSIKLTRNYIFIIIYKNQVKELIIFYDFINLVDIIICNSVQCYFNEKFSYSI